jgi:hypothetical protein
MGLVATMAALVLGLLVGSAKNAYDTERTDLTNMSSQLITLDQILAHYGPETREIRDGLRNSATHMRDELWAGKPVAPGTSAGSISRHRDIFDRLENLSPRDDEQRAIRAQAFSMFMGLGQTRWLMYEERTDRVSTPLLVVLVFWLTAIFVSFGLFAPTNLTVIASLGVAALSVSAAVLLILEMYQPFTGFIQISPAPLNAALAAMGQPYASGG